MLVAAGLLRVGYYLQLEGGPLIEQHRATETDMHFFDQWARRMAAGDWLTSGGFHPHHRWHEVLAQRYLAENPAAAGGLSLTPGPDGASPAGRALWTSWWGGARWHQEPLYPVMIAGLYRLFSPDPRVVLLFQLLLGLLTLLCAYRLARALFGEAAALAATVLLALCGPVLFFELSLLRTSVAVFLILLTTALACQARAQLRAGPLFAAGLAGGLLLALELKYALLPLGLLVLLGWPVRQTWRALLRVAAVYGGGLVIVLAPLMVRNALVGAPLLSWSSVGLVSFVCTNVVDAPLTGEFRGDSPHAARILGEYATRTWAAVAATIATHGGAADFLGYVLRRAALSWHVHEFPNNVNFYYYRLHAPILHLAPLNFGLLAPLGLVGLVLAWRSGRRAEPLVLALAATALPLVLFTVLARYRAPATALLALFAGYALVRCVEWLWSRRPLRHPAFLGASAAGLLLAAAAWRPLNPPPRLMTGFDWGVVFRFHYEPRFSAARRAQDDVALERELAAFLRVRPPAVRRARPDHPPAELEDALVVQMYADLGAEHAQVLARLGRAAESERRARRAADLHAAAAAASERGFSPR